MILRPLALVSLAVLTLSACKQPPSATKATVAEAAPQAALAAPPAASAEALPISAADSKISFVGAKVTGTHDGGFKKFTGTIHFDPARVEASRIEVEIDMDSVWTDNDNLTGHLKTGDFFLVEEHPTAKFVSTAIKADGEGATTHTITGNLTLRGVTKSVTIPAKLAVSPDAVRATSTFSLPRQQFGVAFAGQPDNLIRDDVVVTLDVAAPRQGAAAAPVETEAAR